MRPETIRRKREALKLSQEALARKLDVTMQVVSNWERGNYRPNEENAKKLRAIFESAGA